MFQGTARYFGRFIHRIWGFSSPVISIFVFSPYFLASVVALHFVILFFWPETLSFIRTLYTACNMPFPSSKCQLFSIFDYIFSSAFRLFVFCLKFIVVMCKSVGLAEAYWLFQKQKCISVLLLESIQCISSIFCEFLLLL